MYLKRTVLTFNGVYPSVFSYISFYSPLNDLLKVFIWSTFDKSEAGPKHSLFIYSSSD